MKKTDSKEGLTASQQIDKHIKDLTDWRGKMMTRLRKLIREAAPELTEEWKWDTPVWSHKGNVVAAGVFNSDDRRDVFWIPNARSRWERKGIFSGREKHASPGGTRPDQIEIC